MDKKYFHDFICDLDSVNGALFRYQANGRKMKNNILKSQYWTF